MANTGGLLNRANHVGEQSMGTITGLYAALDEINPQDNLAANAAPTVNNDSTEGYQPRSIWIYNGVTYRCIDATPGAAVWVETGISADDLGSAAFASTADFDPAGAAQAAAEFARQRANQTGTQPLSTIEGVGAAASRNVVGGSGDLMAQGAYGLGKYGMETGSDNYLDPDIPMGAQANGFRAIVSSSYPVGLPEELQQAWASVLLNKRTSTVGAGILQSISNDVFFFRVLDEEIVRVYQAITTNNVLGSVSGPSVIEYGSNSDGRYCIFKGGLCMQTVEQVIDLSQQGDQLFLDLPLRMQMPYTVSYDTNVTTGNMSILRAARDLFVTSYGGSSLSIRKGTDHFTNRQDNFVFTVWGYVYED